MYVTLIFFYKFNTVFETKLSEYENMVSQKTKFISNDPKVVLSDAQVENVINITVIYVTTLIFKMPIRPII